MIIGAGAAGLATAIAAGRSAPQRSIVLLDSAARPGAKILVSGGGRCNVTNRTVTEQDFWGGSRTVVRKVLRAFTVAETIEFFRTAGVALHEEADGKLFPDTNRARDVLDALLRETSNAGAALVPGQRVCELERLSGGFRIVTGSGATTARLVVLATGGQALPKSGSDGSGFGIAQRLGHSIVPTTPALAPLLLDPSKSIHAKLSGVSHDVDLLVRVDDVVTIRLSGALLWTHFGISGPVVLNASRHWLRAAFAGRRVTLAAKMCGGRAFDEIDREWQETARAKPRTSVQSALAAAVPASVAAALVQCLDIAGDIALAHLPRADRRRLAHALAEWPLPVIGSRGYTFAEATAGGVALSEIDPATMESRVCPGLSIVGEVLDVDGRIGGFNFQWAWSSGVVAGRALARALAAIPASDATPLD